ncbi:hypothetical protein PR048_010670 [Dryococelus australis]|uniref:Uncharacterized protein n=1 Tax=Dryococelus australis TaxID=614101 RepID=A0ABQ9I3D0_9NEOP|nr:hypothetical protein PR048_010670 [Dryococelus australis]
MTKSRVNWSTNTVGIPGVARTNKNMVSVNTETNTTDISVVEIIDSSLRPCLQCQPQQAQTRPVPNQFSSSSVAIAEFLACAVLLSKRPCGNKQTTCCMLVDNHSEKRAVETQTNQISHKQELEITVTGSSLCTVPTKNIWHAKYVLDPEYGDRQGQSFYRYQVLLAVDLNNSPGFCVDEPGVTVIRYGNRGHVPAVINHGDEGEGESRLASQLRSPLQPATRLRSLLDGRYICWRQWSVSGKDVEVHKASRRNHFDQDAEMFRSWLVSSDGRKAVQCWDTEIGCAQPARSLYLIFSLWFREVELHMVHAKLGTLGKTMIERTVAKSCVARTDVWKALSSYVSDVRKELQRYVIRKLKCPEMKEKNLFATGSVRLRKSDMTLPDRGGVVVRLLPSHLDVPGSITDGVTPEFSQMGIAPDDVDGWRVFSGVCRLPTPFHSGAAPYSPRFGLIASQDLDTVDSVYLTPGSMGFTTSSMTCMLGSTVLFILKTQMYVDWLLPQTVDSVTSHLAVWDSLLVQ